ncbi:MAG: AbrB/MazE/SpoVT family DNA-binding domain-containing protein [Gammaproteobacteria bacterium]|nr:AbrB/MazE/SpoVT family DNA-binding domain-containing protein [Gammaproteobacteria bacterium]
MSQRSMGNHTMKTLVVSNRGQVTLPAAMRKRLGIKGGDVVIVEDRGNEIVLKPGVVLELELYTDAQIAQWDDDDKLDDGERKRIVDAFGGT